MNNEPVSEEKQIVDELTDIPTTDNVEKEIDAAGVVEAEKKVKKTKKKSTGLKWLVLAVLIISLAIFVMMSPALSRYLPTLPTSQTVSGQDKTTKSGTSSQSHSYSQSQADGDKNAAVAVGVLGAYTLTTLAVPVMIALLTIMTFGNMVSLFIISMRLGDIRHALDVLLSSDRKREQ